MSTTCLSLGLMTSPEESYSTQGGDGPIIVYNQIITNEGGFTFNYSGNNDTGSIKSIIIPVSGNYFVNYQIMVNNPNPGAAWTIFNSTSNTSIPQSALYFYCNNFNGTGSVSNCYQMTKSFLTTFNSGDVINVQQNPENINILLTQPSTGPSILLSTITIFLLSGTSYCNAYLPSSSSVSNNFASGTTVEPYYNVPFSQIVSSNFELNSNGTLTYTDFIGNFILFSDLCLYNQTNTYIYPNNSNLYYSTYPEQPILPNVYQNYAALFIDYSIKINNETKNKNFTVQILSDYYGAYTNSYSQNDGEYEIYYYYDGYYILSCQMLLTDILNLSQNDTVEITNLSQYSTILQNYYQSYSSGDILFNQAGLTLLPVTNHCSLYDEGGLNFNIPPNQNYWLYFTQFKSLGYFSPYKASSDQENYTEKNYLGILYTGTENTNCLVNFIVSINQNTNNGIQDSSSVYVTLVNDPNNSESAATEYTFSNQFQYFQSNNFQITGTLALDISPNTIIYLYVYSSVQSSIYAPTSASTNDFTQYTPTNCILNVSN